MGRFIKNLAIHSGSYAVRLPIGSSGIPLVQAQFPVDGQIYFNTTTENVEIYHNSAWHGVGVVGKVAITVDSYTGDGATTLYSITSSYLTGREADMLIFVGSVYQNPLSAYAVNGYNITFTSPPNLGLPIIILHNFNSTNVQ